LKCGVVTGPANWKNLLTFCRAPVPNTDSRSFSIFAEHCGIGKFTDLLVFLIQSPPDFLMKLGEMTDGNKVMNLEHFGTDPAGIQIRVNPDLNLE